MDVTIYCNDSKVFVNLCVCLSVCPSVCRSFTERVYNIFELFLLEDVRYNGVDVLKQVTLKLELSLFLTMASS